MKQENIPIGFALIVILVMAALIYCGRQNLVAKATTSHAQPNR